MRALLPRYGQAAVAAWNLRGITGLVDAAKVKLYWRHRYIRFQVDLATWPVAERRPQPGVEARRGTFEELERFRMSRAGLPMQFYADQIHGARRMYLGLVDGTIGHISWLYTHEDRVPQMPLMPHEVMLDGAYTFPECRGKGLLSAVERAALDDATREGRRAAYTHVAVDNPASIRGVSKTGFRPIGILDWRIVLGVSITQYVDSAEGAMALAGTRGETPMPVGA